MSMMIRDLLQLGQKRLELAGCDSPRLDAEVLFCFLLKEDKSFLFVHFGDSMDEKRCEQYFKLIDERASRRPTAYIVGSKEFMGLSFLVDERVLIPRPDTETLVEQALQLLKERRQPMGGFSVLDLCTGSGAIGVSLACHLKDKRLSVLGCDLSGDALEVAAENAKRNGVAKIVQFRKGDLFDCIPKNKKGVPKETFDLITANPPYIKNEEIPGLQREIAEYEPALALRGGADGLDFYRRIAAEAADFLKKDGLLLMEIGCDQGQSAADIIREQQSYEEPTILQDLAGKDRVAVCTKRAIHKNKLAKNAEKC